MAALHCLETSIPQARFGDGARNIGALHRRVYSTLRRAILFLSSSLERPVADTDDENEWRKKLTPEQYRITREKGTERAFTGKYHDSKDPGIYKCVCCGMPLFDSDAKFESGTGWPSFTAPVDDANV